MPRGRLACTSRPAPAPAPEPVPIPMTFEAPLAPSPGLPLYASVKRSILDRIRSGEWASGHRIPSESELVAELGVSRMTVNRALRELSMEGVLVRMQGLGSFVAEGKQPLGVFECAASPRRSPRGATPIRPGS